MSDSESDDENIIRYGTPLEAYDEDEVPRKKKWPQDPSEQLALDAQGKRRFHGAFTGGFTAGYGNSVAVPEGWKPSTFKSSRSEKANLSNQKAEDFMDEEDRGEFGIAPRTVQTRQEFGNQKRSRQRREFNDGPIPGEPILQQLLQPVHDTAAMKMLKAMGWRPGQGTGERLGAAEKKARVRKNKKVYGCFIPEEYRSEQPSTADTASDANDSDDSTEYEDIKTLFAPDDFEPYLQSPKDNVFGMGYQGLSRRSVLGSISERYGADKLLGGESHLLMREKGKKVSIRGQAFGVGALEDDDDDIYAKEDMSNYDFALGSNKKNEKDGRSNATSEKKSNVLSGFVPAQKPHQTPKRYPPPVLPRDYQPSSVGPRVSRFEKVDTTVEPKKRALGRHELTAQQRGTILGETQTPRDSQQLPQTSLDLASATPEVRSESSREESNNNRTTEGDVKTDVRVADSSVFKPFASDPAKQARYEEFLMRREGKTQTLPEYVAVKDESGSKLQEWEQIREVKEFEQAAKLYKPLSGIMGDRFTHASDPTEDALNPLLPVAGTPSHLRSGATPDQIEAARLGMYGRLTRVVKEWEPASMLCRRFNVAEVGSSGIKQEKADKKKTSIFDYLEESIHSRESFLKEQSQFSGSLAMKREPPDLNKKNPVNNSNAIKEKSIDLIIDSRKSLTEIDNTTDDNKGSNIPIIKPRMTVTELFLMEKEREKSLTQVTKDKTSDKEETETIVKETIDNFNKIDLYKAIFLSDSESEPEIEADSKVNEKEAMNSVINANQLNPSVVNTERNLSPPRGIFANIDFEQLSSENRNRASNLNSKPSPIIADTKQEVPAKVDEEKLEEDTYGPKLPDKIVFQARKESEKGEEIEISSDSDSWVDASEVKSSKSHKKKKKKSTKSKKHKKHKSKSKRKD